MPSYPLDLYDKLVANLHDSVGDPAAEQDATDRFSQDMRHRSYTEGTIEQAIADAYTEAFYGFEGR